MVLINLYLTRRSNYIPIPPPEPEPGEIDYSNPIVITSGGTYTGNWKSLDPATPAVTVKTTAPVIIENSNIFYAGAGIKNGVHNIDVTIRNVKGRGPFTMANFIDPVTFKVVKTTGNNFALLASAKNILIENCDFEKTGGISIERFLGDGTSSQTIKVRNNKARNMLTRHFVKLFRIYGVANIEVCWNEYIGEPDASAVEDIITNISSSGTLASPLRIRNNFLKGAYPYPATGANKALHSTGSGIMTEGAAEDTPTTVPRYALVEYNQTVATNNAGINIAGGNNITYNNNRVVNAGIFPNGTRHFYGAMGMNIFKFQSTHDATHFNNNKILNTYIGFYNVGDKRPYINRNDYNPYNEYSGGKDGCSVENVTAMPDVPLTLADEASEYTYWLNKLSANSKTIGTNF